LVIFNFLGKRQEAHPEDRLPQPTESTTLRNRLEGLNPGSLLIQTAQQAILEGRYQEAARPLKQALVLDPKNADAHLWLARVLMHLDEGVPAQHHAETARGLSPNPGETLITWAGWLQEMGRVEEALPVLEFALTQYPALTLQARLGLSQCYFLQGLYREALVEVRQVLRQQPNNYEALLQQAALLIEMLEPEALSVLAQLQQQYPRRFEPLYLAASCLFQQGRFVEAAERGRQALEHAPDHPELFVLVGEALAKTDRHELAIANYRHALRLRPHFPEATLGVAQCLTAMGRGQEARQTLESLARASDPAGPWLTTLGVVWLQLDESQRALAAFEKALTHRPDDPEIHYMVCSLGMNDRARWPRLRQMAQQQMKCYPQDGRWPVVLGRLCLLQEQFAEATPLLEHARRLLPREGEVLKLLALAAQGSGQYDSAHHWLDLLRQFPEYAQEAKRLQAAVAMSQDDTKRAEPLLRELIVMTPQDVEVRLLLVQLLLRRASFEEAQQHLETLQFEAPNDPEVQFLTGVLHSLVAHTLRARQAKLEAFQKAKEAFHTAVSLNAGHVLAWQELFQVTYALEQENTPQFLKAFRGYLRRYQHQPQMIQLLKRTATTALKDTLDEVTCQQIEKM
jgi:tetratricopeptide (TPR) repeat protein